MLDIDLPEGWEPLRTICQTQTAKRLEPELVLVPAKCGPRRMIAIVAPIIGPLCGADTQAKILTRSLRALGHDVLFCAERDLPADLSPFDGVIWWGRVFEGREKPPGSIYVVRSPGGNVPDDIAAVIDRIDCAVGVSPECTELADRLGLPAVHIPNGVDPAPVVKRPTSGRFTIGYLGRYAPEKGLDRILDAMRLLPHWVYLRMHGTGSQRDRLAREAEDLGERVEIGEPIPNESVGGFFAAVDCLALPSDYEGHPMAAAEALAHGVPVLSTIDADWTSVLVQPTPHSIAARIMCLAEGDEPQRSVVVHTAKKMATGYLNVVRAVRPRVLCLADQRGWAMDNGHRDMERHLRDRFSFAHHAVNGWPAEPLPDMNDFDIIFSPYSYWRCDAQIPREKTVSGNRSQFFHASASQEPPTEEDRELVRSYRAYHVVTRRCYTELAETCPNVRHLPNPVNVHRFQPTTATGCLACWAGNSRRITKDGRSVKGLQEYTEPACAAAGVPLAVTDYDGARRTHDEMTAWYRNHTVLVQPSLFEGCSKVFLEAAASALAIIATDVGMVREFQDSQLRHLGDTGIIVVERDVEQIAAALRTLKSRPERIAEMGRLNRAEAEARWSWDVWADAYAEFLREAL